MERWLVVLGLSGCSLALSGPDPNRPRTEMPKCDTGKGLVVADAVIASALGIGAVAALGSDSSSTALVPLLLGAAFVGAAIHGSSQVDQCRKAIDDFALAPHPMPTPMVAAAPPQLQPLAQPLPQPPPPPPPQPQPQPQPQLQPRPQPQSQSQPAPQPSQWSSFWKEVP